MSRSTRSTLSVVVCCYSLERWDLLQRTIASLRRQIRPIDQLVIVVDHNDLLLERLRSMPDATVVANDGRRGLSDARNTGVRHAAGEVVAFLDDDVEAEPSWSLHLMRPYRDAAVIGVGGQVVPRFETRRPAWLVPEFDWVVGCTYSGHRATRGPVRNFIGANMSFRRSMFDSVDGFRNDLGRTGKDGAGCEETELCLRATRELGGGMFYEPAAVVEHFVPEARATHAYFRMRCRAEGRSKTTIARLAGRERGLASERSYVTRTLPAAVWRELTATVLGRARGGFGRIRTIVEAVLWTVLGYVSGLVAGPEPATTFEPILVTEVDAEHPRVIAARAAPDGRQYGRVLALVRRRGSPVGFVEAELPEQGLTRARVAGLAGDVAAASGLEPAAPAAPPVDAPVRLPAASVIVATCGRPELLRRCLDSLTALDYPEFEIVVVANGSAVAETDAVVADVARRFPSLRAVHEPVPGLARAHNRGVDLATGSVLAFTDDDVIADRGWLRQLLTPFATDPKVGCVTGMIVPAELDTQSQAWVEGWAGLRKGIEPRRYSVNPGVHGDPLFPFAAGRFGSGANMAVRADVLRAVGGFDDALGAGTVARGGDDLATFFDVITAGYALQYQPAAVVFHSHRPDYASLRREAFGYGVGMGAYLAHVVATQPRRALRAARLARPALRHYLAPTSAKNAQRPSDFPQELVWRERAGLVAGPWSYVRSRRRVSREARLRESSAPGASRT